MSGTGSSDRFALGMLERHLTLRHCYVEVRAGVCLLRTRKAELVQRIQHPQPNELSARGDETVAVGNRFQRGD
jgi:hypothetical protein